ncbi:MAG: hypothetical protein ACKPJT_23460 [Microcystis panniformis]
MNQLSVISYQLSVIRCEFSVHRLPITAHCSQQKTPQSLTDH